MYGSTASSPIDTENLIDSGSGAGIDIDVLSGIETFSVEGFNTTNGVSTDYYITWFTEIDTKADDYLEINLAPELEMVTRSNDDLTLDCEGLNGISSIRCEKDANSNSLLRINLLSVTQ